MRLEVVILVWAVFAASIIYWDIQRRDEPSPVYSRSVCHNAEIRIMNERPVCLECKLYCEVK